MKYKYGWGFIFFGLLIIIGIIFYNIQRESFSTNSNPIGLWKAEKAYSFNDTANNFEETDILFDTYIEFTSNGSLCTSWEGDFLQEICTEWTESGKKDVEGLDIMKCINWTIEDNQTFSGPECSGYDTYTFSKNIINVSQQRWEGPEFHYKWKRMGNSLELISEVFDNETSTWITFLKYDYRLIIKILN